MSTPRALNWLRRPWAGPLSAAAFLVGCGTAPPQRTSVGDPLPTAPPSETGGMASVSSAGSAAVAGGGGGRSTPVVETPIDMTPPLPSTPSTLTPTILGPFASCGTGEPTVLAEAQSGGGAAIAVDEARVYYGTRHGVMAVPIEGGTPELFAAGGLPIQIAVDQDAVYFSDNGVLRADKLSGKVTILVDQVTLGVAVRGPDVYFSTWALKRTGIGHWSDGVVDSVVEFDAEDFVPRLIVSDQDLFYAPLSTDAVLPATRYKLSENSGEPLAQLKLARSFSVTSDSFYFTEESTRSVKKVTLAGGEPIALGVFDGYPVAIAADDAHVYITLHDLDPTTHEYSGHVVRLSVDGTSPCELGAFESYTAALTVDERYVYWQTSGKADSASSVVMRALK